jgi:hypothetical protein
MEKIVRSSLSREEKDLTGMHTDRLDEDGKENAGFKASR